MYELKRLLGEYGVLEIRQIIKYFHYKEEKNVRNMLVYMARNGQIVTQKNRFVALGEKTLQDGPDWKRINSFWALLEFIQTISYHIPVDYPAQIYFFSDDAEYEIIHVALGDENLINSIFARKEKNEVRYIVVVEEPRQLETLEIPGAQWFCTVGPDGSLEKYIQEE